MPLKRHCNSSSTIEAGQKRGWFWERNAYGNDVDTYRNACCRDHLAFIIVSQPRVRCMVKWATDSIAYDDTSSPKVTEAFLERVLEFGGMLQGRSHSANCLITTGPICGTFHGLLFDDARVLAEWLATSLRHPKNYEPGCLVPFCADWEGVA